MQKQKFSNIKHTAMVQLIGGSFLDEENKGKIRHKSAQNMIYYFKLATGGGGIPGILHFSGLLQTIRHNAG